MSSQAVTVRFHQSGVTRGRGELARFTRSLLGHALGDLAWDSAALTVLFCSNAEIRRLNREFRHIDAPTDVLSFPAVDDLKELRGEKQPYLGDIAISLPYMASLAKKEGRKPSGEAALLLVHGLLHLLGWDHDTSEARRAMWRKQQSLLDSVHDIPLPKFTIRSQPR